jgi:2,4-dienoyl-CoA reductase-like NADH-dependent reductase (Old Yellow Enzyme family)
MPTLFTPAAAGTLPLPNRIVMAPMTRSRAVQDAAPNALVEEHYSQRASAGLILTEGTATSASGLGYARTPSIHTPEQVAAWSRVTAAVHAKGGRIALQIMHVGRIAHPANQPAGARILAPSAIAANVNMWTDSQGMQPVPQPEALSVEEIHSVVAEFAQAARNARDAGFDAAEIHSANGYLPNQFLSPNSNHRTDDFGGSPQNRIRFVLALFDAMAAAWEPGRIGIRISPAGAFNDISDPEALVTYPLLATELASRGAAWLHVVKADSPSFPNWADLRANFPGTLILNNGLTQDTATELLASGQADLVSFGRPFIANPDLVERFQHHWPLASPDPTKFYTPGPEGYIDYPPYSQA